MAESAEPKPMPLIRMIRLLIGSLGPFPDDRPVPGRFASLSSGTAGPTHARSDRCHCQSAGHDLEGFLTRGMAAFFDVDRKYGGSLRFALEIAGTVAGGRLMPRSSYRREKRVGGKMRFARPRGFPDSTPGWWPRVLANRDRGQ